ncbi:MAG TPA: LysR family transcriptional regulator, partial [Denitromonas sp.]|nr:LysR family transcriptional regulator [Denitromonas sp.]
MNITLRQLRAFIAVSRTGSFTLAAESLFVTQSALSGLIKELESSLGLRLIDRSTRRIQLSDTGRELYPLVGKILNDLDTVLDEVANLKALKKGTVRVAAPQLMACTLLPEVIAAYSAEHPDIR